MKLLLASTLAAAVAAASPAAIAQTSGGSDSCAIGQVTGVGGTAQSFREYLATPDRDKIRYVTDHPLQCQISDEDRATGCTGVTDLRRERVSVYDDSGASTMAVVARVELDQGTYPVIILVRKQDVKCEQQ